MCSSSRSSRCPQRPLVVVLLVLGGRHLAVGVDGGVAQPVPALPRQDHPQGGPPVVTLHHRLHLEIFQIIEKYLTQIIFNCRGGITKYYSPASVVTSLDCTTQPKLDLIFSKQFAMLSWLIPLLQSSIMIVRKPSSCAWNAVEAENI